MENPGSLANNEEYFGYIYKTTNLINGKIYIGQKRGSIRHDYLGSGILINKAIIKYGKNNFKLEILSYASTLKMLNGLEIKFIYEYRQVYGNEFLYNISDGGGGGNLGDEVNKKISIAAKTRRFSKETRETWSKNRKGKLKSLEHRRRIGEAHKGKKESQENIEKNRIGHLGQKSWLKGKKQYPHVIEASRKAHKNTRYMCNLLENKNRMVPKDDVDAYLKNGWIFGRKEYVRNQ